MEGTFVELEVGDKFTAFPEKDIIAVVGEFAIFVKVRPFNNRINAVSIKNGELFAFNDTDHVMKISL